MTAGRRILVTIPSDPIASAAVLQSVSEVLRLRGFAIDPISMHHPQLRQRLHERATTGVLAMGCDEPLLRAIHATRKPAVATHNPAWNRYLPVIAIDEEAAGEMAAEHLLARGFRQLGFIGTDQHWSLSREAGFARAGAKRAAISVICSRPRSPGQRHAWASLMRRGVIERWVTALPTPIGVFACNDQTASRVQEACLAVGLRVPQDVSIVGMDNNVVVCTQAPIALSSVEPDAPRIGLEAARLLLQLIGGQKRPTQPVLIAPRRIEVRPSSDMFAFASEDLNAALRHIAQNAGEPLSLRSLVRAVNVSRAGLHRLFKQHLGYSPGHHIRLCRLRDARHLLLTTNWSMVSIAMHCGFSSQSYFAQAFSHAYGESPSAYRESAARTDR